MSAGMSERKERGVLFNAKMVRAILAGTKTQTWRTRGLEDINDDTPNTWTWDGASFTCKAPYAVYWPGQAPLGKPGDRLWLREKWRPFSWYPNKLVIQYAADLKFSDVEAPDTSEGEAWSDRLLQQCSEECIAAGISADDDGMFAWETEEENPIKWRPSIHMPRWASRITLEITDVRVKRVQEISYQLRGGLLERHPEHPDWVRLIKKEKA